MAELFDTTPQNITQHLKKIYQDKEADEMATCKDFLQVQNEGAQDIERKVKIYSLEAIIALGYRVNSERATQFRQWATGILKNYIHKGYALDSNRMKYGFLKFSEYEILTNVGKVSHKIAEALALQEYEKYRVIQDKNYISDFDREVKKILKKSKKGGK